MLRGFLIFAGALILAAGGYLAYRSATASRSLPEWETAPVSRGRMTLTVAATGRVEPRTTVQVGCQVSGIVKEVKVEPDQKVKQGEELASLDRELLDAELQDRNLARDQARLRVAGLEVEKLGLELREGRLKQNSDRLKLEVERAKAVRELAQRNHERWKEMARSSAVNQADLEARQLEAENAARDVALRELELQALELDRRQLVADRQALEVRRKEAELAVSLAEQAVKKAKTNLGYAGITAPIEGVVLERSVDPGQTVAAAFQAPVLFRLAASLETVQITAKVDEVDIGRLNKDSGVSFEVDAYRGERFPGKVLAVRLKHEMSGNLVAYPVIVEAPNPPTPEFPYGKLRPGMTAYLTFEVGRKDSKEKVRVPAAALRFAPPEGLALPEPRKAERGKTGGGKPEALAGGAAAKVYVPEAGGLLRPLAIRVGETDGEFYELLSGELEAGAEVVTGIRKKAER